MPVYRTSVALLIASGLFAAQSVQPSRPRVVDLGHPLRAQDPSWDGSPAFDRRIVATIDKDGYTSGRITVDEHFGTHVDAPAHFAPRGWTVEQIPAERLIRPAVCIDVSSSVATNTDYQVTVDDIKAVEGRAGRIPKEAIVLIATGWDQFWNDRARYMNEKNGVKHFPGLTPEASTYLARDRQVAAIGIDTPSIDYGPSATFAAHRASMSANVYHIENAARLTTLPATGFEVVVAPINISGGSGGPARVFALLK
jgi:kynurenine formamidase